MITLNTTLAAQGRAIASLELPAEPATYSNVVPTGVPLIYGEELGLRYDDVSPTDPQRADTAIRYLAQYDMGLQLEGESLDRYINILYKMENGISCEYCCGARSIIFENGEPACGCAHSFAMRGLAKYLLTQHGSEYSDAEILEELGKWKTLFFPGQMGLKAQMLEEQGIEFNYINLASNKYRGIEQGQAAGGMVGGC
ncbi:hypothetical protein COV20_05665 [Candidatus Woesearchaeota archaeon CG10_big_fil_rev_8_21_14_0_10_45_16]|nr:MAG: hypothetical protein COV20_05665 [Candidatus Woesearchaeota archaeon CG10_big_fil_rev_8_21_14_0_10_45_16]